MAGPKAVASSLHPGSQIQWFHTIDLGNGVVTPGRDRTPKKLKRIGLPESLAGKTVLDIGAWDGFFSFEAERRGAARVLATDSFIWQGRDWGGKQGFEYARAALHSRVGDHTIDVMDLSPEALAPWGGTFDVVLFLGVLYHLKHPLLALEHVASVTADGGMLLLETETDLGFTRRPAIAFYPGAELRRDPTNWCGPNVPALLGMLRTVGFQRLRVHSHYHFPTVIARAVYRRLFRRDGFWRSLQRNRVVVHAWR